MEIVCKCPAQTYVNERCPKCNQFSKSLNFEENKKLRDLLKRCLYEIEEHRSDYHHITSKDLMKELRDVLSKEK